ncbi:hypothetical protein QFZ34_001164 [Phyllobacterium ifriqiyense]|uniref:Conjugal transfer protein TraH n=1 Tax=Phyllobacterium ifriqiyense TaxID=314238 RepID=A0ABU0S5G1_9HYPH|nr:TraH family protein [Phyllobacterium ifriqiyense]MDQ0995987.1 hypothetical protein [Phyllobacterium ifriqiyense]
MLDAALIQQCADPSLETSLVQHFIARAGSSDPLAVTVRSGNRVILVEKPATPDEAVELIRRNVARNIVRVGITQYPAGLGIVEAAQIETDLVDSCANIRMGTALFAKVDRIVLKWYGAPANEAFEDAIIAWQTGYFEGNAVFGAADPGGNGPVVPVQEQTAAALEEDENERPQHEARPGTEAEDDPNRAALRVDLSAIGGIK